MESVSQFKSQRTIAIKTEEFCDEGILIVLR